MSLWKHNIYLLESFGCRHDSAEAPSAMPTAAAALEDLLPRGGLTCQ
jgi:hypothetical protein